MKRAFILSLSVLMVSVAFSCYAQDNKTKGVKVAAAEKVEAYYFHLTARCVTCKAVESEAKTDIEKLYGGKISFQSINLDDASSKDLAEKLHFVRYADDMMIFCKSKKAAHRTLNHILPYIER